MYNTKITSKIFILHNRHVFYPRSKIDIASKIDLDGQRNEPKKYDSKQSSLEPQKTNPLCEQKKFTYDNI